jgi:hypothetical protein
MEPPAATTFFMEEINKAKANPDPEYHARLEAAIAEAETEYRSRRQMVSLFSFTYQHLMLAGLIQPKQKK